MWSSVVFSNLPCVPKASWPFLIAARLLWRLRNFESNEIGLTSNRPEARARSVTVVLSADNGCRLRETRLNPFATPISSQRTRARLGRAVRTAYAETNFKILSASPMQRLHWVQSSTRARVSPCDPKVTGWLRSGWRCFAGEHMEKTISVGWFHRIPIFTHIAVGSQRGGRAVSKNEDVAQIDASSASVRSSDSIVSGSDSCA